MLQGAEGGGGFQTARTVRRGRTIVPKIDLLWLFVSDRLKTHHPATMTEVSPRNQTMTEWTIRVCLFICRDGRRTKNVAITAVVPKAIIGKVFC